MCYLLIQGIDYHCHMHMQRVSTVQIQGIKILVVK